MKLLVKRCLVLAHLSCFVAWNAQGIYSSLVLIDQVARPQLPDASARFVEDSKIRVSE